MSYRKKHISLIVTYHSYWEQVKQKCIYKQCIYQQHLYIRARYFQLAHGLRYSAMQCASTFPSFGALSEIANNIAALQCTPTLLQCTSQHCTALHSYRRNFAHKCTMNIGPQTNTFMYQLPRPNWISLYSEFVSPLYYKRLWFSPLASLKIPD